MVDFIIQISLWSICLNIIVVYFFWSSFFVCCLPPEYHDDCKIITTNVIFRKPATTYSEQDGLILTSKNWRQWTNFAFLAAVSSPIPPLTYWSNTMSRKLSTKAKSGMYFIYPKVRDWVVVKEDDKILCHKKVVYINTNRDHLCGNP